MPKVSKKSNAKSLLSDSDSSDEEKSPGRDSRLKINKKFAEKFEAESRFKELQRAKDVDLEGNSSDSETSESEDEDGELLDSKTDLQIVKTINMIRKKDPKIYDASNVFFEKIDKGDSDDDEGEGGKKKGAKSKRSTYKDVIREQLLDKGADLNAEDDDADVNYTKTKSLAYDREQEEIRKAFLKKSGGSDDSDSSSDDDMLVVKKRSPAEEAADKKELESELKKMEKANNEEGDKFLADYISQKKWMQEDNMTGDGSDEGDEADAADDEEELDEVDRFESSYNFRFEEEAAEGEDSARPGAFHAHALGEIRGHSRNLEGTVRQASDKRKKAREERAERKERERRQKEEELKRLKNLKRQELQARLKQVSKAGGLREMGLNEDTLEEEWDEAKHEAMMAAQFGGDYYDEEDEELTGHMGALGEGEGGYEDEVDRFINEVDYGENADDDDQDDEEDYNGDEYDEDGEPVAPQPSKEKPGKKKGASKSKALREVAEKMMDELYELDYEDVVAGMPTRFKYRQVEAESYGLNTGDILLAEDQELNKVVGLSKLAAYNMSAVDPEKLSKKRKRLRSAMKERLDREAEEAARKGETVGGVGALGGGKGEEGEPADEDGRDEVAADASEKKKRKRRKKGATLADGRDAGLAAEREKSLQKEKSKDEKKDKKDKKDKKARRDGKDKKSKSKAKVASDRMSLYK